MTGWVRYRKNIYYLNNKGILTKGWVGTCYLLKKTGIRASGFKTISGKTYRITVAYDGMKYDF